VQHPGYFFFKRHAFIAHPVIKDIFMHQINCIYYIIKAIYMIKYHIL